MCVHVSYMEACMYMCMCVLHGGCVCIHTYTYIPFRYNPQVGHTHNAYPAPGRMDTHISFHRTLMHSPHTLHVGRMHTCIYHPLDKTHTTLYVHTFYVGQIHIHTTTL